jgi:lipopolysaccharide/colanic/teichoic acid biosynthesis glycosyltransferase
MRRGLEAIDGVRIPRRRRADRTGVDGDCGELGLYARAFKPLLDVLMATLLLLAMVPILVGVAMAVYVEYGRPIFFRQSRVGRGGRVFLVTKFRTMEPDRRSPAGRTRSPDRRRTHKSQHDPRVRPVGRFLRTWSLDELPQLLNVLAGDMSLVGPRPELVRVVESYEDWQHARHRVKPGLTGLWQVSAREIPLHEATHIDLEYLRHLSLGEDMRILARTLPAAFGSRKGF